jgi:hypothetical protein
MFMVDTGAMVSLSKPGISSAQLRVCEVQARGISGTLLSVSGEQEVEFSIRPGENNMTFIHTFVVSPLDTCSSGILGLDFLQQVGAGISLTTLSLTVGDHLFPLPGWTQEASTNQSLANDGWGEATCQPNECNSNEPVEDWVGTVELAEAVTVPPLSGRIARCRVVRRSDLEVEIPRNQVVMVDPERLPGIYMARVVATLNNCDIVSSSLALAAQKRWSEDFVGINGKSNVHLPPDKGKILEEQRRLDGDGRRLDGDGKLRGNPSGIRKITGSGECQQERPDGSLLKLAASPEVRNKRDLQGVNSSLPVENRIGNQDDTKRNYKTSQQG